jgi:hypothetical protein
MSTLEERLQARIDLLKAELNKLVEDANKQIAAYQVAIAELEGVLSPPEKKEEDTK